MHFVAKLINKLSSELVNGFYSNDGKSPISAMCVLATKTEDEKILVGSFSENNARLMDGNDSKFSNSWNEEVKQVVRPIDFRQWFPNEIKEPVKLPNQFKYHCFISHRQATAQYVVGELELNLKE